MPSEPIDDFVPRKRLHRFSWLFVAVQYLRHFILPVAVAVFAGVRNDQELWPLAAIVLLIAGALWEQWVYRYDFGPRGLVIREGLFFRNVRNIDYRRVENIDTERNLLHRLLGVAEVRVETSSGGSSEAVIRVLSLAAVDEMRERIFAARESASGVRDEATPSEEPEEELLHLSPGELVRYGLIDNRGMIVVAAVLGVFAEFARQQAIERFVQPIIDRFPLAEFATLGPFVKVFLFLSAITGLVAATRLLSVLLALVTLHDFRLSRRGEDLRVHHGLFTRVALTMRRPRIQAAHQVESLLHRLFHRVSLRVDLAGGIGSNGNQQQGQTQSSRKLWLAPVCTTEQARTLLGTALPQVELEGLEWQQLSSRARGRLFRLLAATWLLLSAPPAFGLLGVNGAAIVLPVIPFLWLHAWLYTRYTAWAMHDEFFALRRGWLTRRLSVVPRNRIQSVLVSESPFDRRHAMAGLHIDTAGASARPLRIPYLDANLARRLAFELFATR